MNTQNETEVTPADYDAALRLVLGEHERWLDDQDTGRQLDLSYANLTRAHLIGANLTGAGLHDATLTGAWLPRATLGRANLGGADLSGANLSEATLTFATLTDATVGEDDLDGLITIRPATNAHLSRTLELP